MSKQTSEKSVHSGNIIKGTLLLTIAGICSKILGVLFKVPLHAMIGDEGLGYYTMIYPLYSLLIAISYAGIPAVVSKTISAKYAEGKTQEAYEIFRKSLRVLTLLGLACTIIVLVFNKEIVHLFGWESNTRYSLYAISLSPIFISIMGTFRGYFQGMNNMQPTAISQVIEALFKVVLGLLFVYILIQSGFTVSIAVSGAMLGISFSSLIAAIYLGGYSVYKNKSMRRYNKNQSKDLQKADANQKDNVNPKEINLYVKTILFEAIPVAIASACYSLINFVDSATVVNKLVGIGLDPIVVTQLYGEKGKAETFVNIPLTISLALVIVIIPAISVSKQLNKIDDLKEKIRFCSNLSFILALPAALGIFLLAEPIMKIFYFKDFSGVELLRIYAPCIIFIIMGQTSASIIQGTGEVKRPIVHLIMALVTKVILNQLLVNEVLLISGAVISSIISFIVYTAFNYYYLYTHYSFKIDIKTLGKALLSCLVMGIVVKYSYDFLTFRQMHLWLRTILVVLLGVLVYFIVLIKTKGILLNHLDILPFGGLLKKIIKKEDKNGK